MFLIELIYWLLYYSCTSARFFPERPAEPSAPMLCPIRTALLTSASLGV